jgi:GNAT superfamily N-acetyltransferase
MTIDGFILERVDGSEQLAEQLGELLIDCVEGGASVGFLTPLAPARAANYWRGILASVERDERVMFVVRCAESGELVGTVQLVLAQMENQPHRGEISKLLVHRSARRLGLAEWLMAEAEQAALDLGRDLLVLDTTGDGAERLYLKLGWQMAGTIPGFALYPDATLAPTTLFYKQLS